MFFLLKAVFWIAVVAMLMPADSSVETRAPATIAALATDASGTLGQRAIDWCVEEPTRCRESADVAQRFGIKVTALARVMGAVIESRFAPPVTGSTKQP